MLWTLNWKPAYHLCTDLFKFGPCHDDDYDDDDDDDDDDDERIIEEVF